MLSNSIRLKPLGQQDVYVVSRKALNSHKSWKMKTSNARKIVAVPKIVFG